MEQLWLVLGLLSFVTGFGVIAVLLVLKRIVPLERPPVVLIGFALMAIGFANISGVYLSVLGIPRNVIVYKVVNAVAWGFPAAALLWFVLAETAVRRGFMKPRIATGFAIAWGAVVLVASWITVHPRANAEALVQPVTRTITVLGIAGSIAALGFVVAVLSIRCSKAVASRPWKLFLRRLGYVLVAIISVQMIDLGIGVVGPLTGVAWRDGFMFAATYGVANVLLIIAIIRGLRSDGAASGSTAIPEGFVTAFGITRREREILDGIVQGATYRTIAESLYISPRTVETHVNTIFRKCGVNSRAQVVHLLSTFPGSSSAGTS